MDDSKTRVEHRCERCGKIFTRAKHHEKHVAKCDGTYIPRAGEAHGIENVDYVRCKICGFVATTLSKHLSSIHVTAKEEYVQQFPGSLITCEKSAAKFKARGVNGDWIRRANERGDDLTEYKKKMGEAVRKSIMSNPKERARRSELAKMTINAWATSDEGRRIASETAKKTSARPEILEQRTKRLVDSYKPSKGERVLQIFLTPFGFKRNVLIKSHEFSTSTHKRQIDFMNRDRKIAIEFDGSQHFVPAWKRMPLDRIHVNDVELGRWCINNGYTLIRIGYAHYVRKHEIMSDECIKYLTELLTREIQPGVYLLGKEYTQYNHPVILESGVHFIGDAYVQREVAK
jgi:very-short-patch-repair endonuclease/DNA-directed RNA polymerase subunit RPC12/RpoP